MNWADTPLFVYAAVEAHPARSVVEAQFGRGDWASPVAALSDCYHVLTRNYEVAGPLAAAAVTRLGSLPFHWASFEARHLEPVVELRVRYGIEATDALLLLLSREDHGTLVTVDGRLLRAARDEGVSSRNPITPDLERAIGRWEAENLAPRGLRRLLRLVERWLRERNAAVADQFVEATARLTTLP